METHDFNGKWICPITSDEGQKHYYAHYLYWRVCYSNSNPVIVPTKEQAMEYKQLLAEKETLKPWSKGQEKQQYNKLELYNRKYDWRPTISGSTSNKGLIAPDGTSILPELFVDIFTQFDAINSKPLFLPVFNGKAWGLIALTTPLIMATEFNYKTILPERWDRDIFFVQDMNTDKWGALKISHARGNSNDRRFKTLPLIKTLMPCIADEIFEDELMTDCAPTTFWVTRVGSKIGILTPWGFSDIVYDDYTTNAEHLTLRLIRNDRKRAKVLKYYF